METVFTTASRLKSAFPTGTNPPGLDDGDRPVQVFLGQVPQSFHDLGVEGIDGQFTWESGNELFPAGLRPET